MTITTKTRSITIKITKRATEINENNKNNNITKATTFYQNHRRRSSRLATVVWETL